jgi:hypothetical protein
MRIIKLSEKRLFVIILFFFKLSVHAQDTIPAMWNDSRTAKFEKVYDNFGNIMPLRRLSKSTGGKSLSGIPGNSPNAGKQIAQTCTSASSCFSIDFEIGCGMDGTTPNDVARRAVICAVFQDVSNFISPASLTNKCRILIQATNDFPAVLPANYNAFGTSYYATPYQTNIGGIADNVLFLTIKSGLDAWQNIAMPSVVNPSLPLYGAGQTNNANDLYHAVFGVDPLINWYTNLGTNTIAPNQTDLYSKILHEVIHTLGFSSLIKEDGTSLIPSGNYYSRYDMFLKSNGANIISSSGPCPIYNNSFIAPTSILTPNTALCTPDFTNCANVNIVEYTGSITQPVYLPNCWELGKSLSHFEDLCMIPPANNSFFVMSNLLPAATLKRSPTLAERSVLCDLGYQTTNSFGGIGNLNNVTYSPVVCNNVNIIGVNDGISSTNTYSITVTAGNAVSFSSILSNDINATGFTCLEDISGSGTLNVTAGNNVTSIIYTASASSGGFVLLRYIPTNGLQSGNITYVYIYIMPVCLITAPTVCGNLVSNSGFANFSSYGPYGALANNPSCWQGIMQTPDLYSYSGIYGGANFCGGATTRWTLPTFMCNPLLQSYNGQATNNSFIGLVALKLSTTSYIEEWTANNLLTNLIPGQSYVFKCKARVWNRWATPGFNLNCSGANPLITNPSVYNLGLFFTSNTLPIAGNNINLNTLTAGVNHVVSLLNPISIPFNNQWNQVSIPFTYPAAGNANLSKLYLGAESDNISQIYFNGENQSYIYVDDVEVIPSAQALVFNNFPTCAPANGIINNLNQFVNLNGGVFSGNGIVNTAGTFSFNSTLLGPGIWPIIYTYTSPNGCVQTLVANISWTPPIAITGNNCITATTTTTLTANPVALTSAISWNAPGIVPILTNPAIINTPGVYTLTVTNGICAASNTFLVTGPLACNSSATLLSGTLTASPAAAPAGYKVSAPITLQGTYTINAHDIAFINTTASVTIPNGSNITISGSRLHGCSTKWIGIKVLPGGKLTINNNSLIEDANIGVDYLNPTASAVPLLVCSTAIFNNNTVGVSIQNYQYNTVIPFTFTNCVFTARQLCSGISGQLWPTVAQLKTTVVPTDNLLTPSVMMNAVVNPQVDKHIYLWNVGFANGTLFATTYLATPITNCLFDNARQGISAWQASTNISASIFQRSSIGIFSIMDFNSPLFLAQYRLSCINSNFYNCRGAIYSDRMFENVLTGNNVRASLTNHYGIYFNTINSKANNVSNNQLYNVTPAINHMAKVGNVWAFNFPASPTINASFIGNTTISSNTIADRPTGNLSTTANCGQAIACSELGVVPIGFTNYYAAPKLIISNNTLTNVRNGISVSNFDAISSHSIQESNNTITLKLNTVATAQVGIGNYSNQNIYCKSNTVTGPALYALPTSTTPPNNYNLTSTSVSPAISNYKFSANIGGTYNIATCNLSQGGCYGFEFNQASNFQWLPLNEMNNQHYYGLLLNSGAVLPAQPANASPTNLVGVNIDNKWNFTPFGTLQKHTFVAGGSPKPMEIPIPVSCLYIRTPINTIYFPGGNTNQHNGASPAANNYEAISPFGLVSVNTTSTPTCTAIPPAPSVMSNSFASIYNGTATNSFLYTNNAIANNYVAQKNLYDAIRVDSANAALNPTIANFYNNCNSSTHPYRKLWDMELALSKRDFGMAAQLKSAFVPANNIEINYLNYIDLHIKMVGNLDLSAENKTSLQNLALRCPHIEGSVIYSARSLFNSLFPENYTIFQDVCAGSGLYKSLDSNFLDKKENKFEVIVFPNPTNDVINISTNLSKDEEIEIIITDLAGSNVLKQKCVTNNSNCFVSMANISDGLYYVTIKNKHFDAIIKKIILKK